MNKIERRLSVTNLSSENNFADVSTECSSRYQGESDRTSLSPERIADLLEMCLRSTYFSFGGNFYEQKEGAAMGSPVSAVVAMQPLHGVL